MRTFFCVIVLSFLTTLAMLGCNKEHTTENSNPPESVTDTQPEVVERTFPEKIFELLKTNNEDLLPEIVISPELEKQLRESLDHRIDDNLTERFMKGVKRTLKVVRDQVAEWGLDWNDAVLTKTEMTSKDGIIEYDPNYNESFSFEAKLTINFNDTVVLVGLDDCINIDGEHRMGDGFRVYKKN